MSSGDRQRERQRIAEAVREACAQAAIEGYEHASISGLCGEGALECAVSAIRQLDVEAAVRHALAGEGGEGAPPLGRDPEERT